MVEVGGGIRSYRAGGRDVMDGYAEDEMCSGGRGQILAPWPNRLADGSFEWEGRQLQLALSEPARHNAIHGLVRWASWTMPDTTPAPWGPQTPVDSVSLHHRLHPQPGWPWTIDLRATYRLSPEGLEVRTWARNESDTPCPFGLGWHPYLHAFGSTVDDATLTLPAASAYRSDERGLPVALEPVEGTDLDFRAGRRIGGLSLDTAFTDLHRDGDGRARVTLVSAAGESTTLWLDRGFSHVMVFTGDSLGGGRARRGLAVEPMTCAADMLRSRDGLVVLEPGAVFEAAWGMQPFS